MSFKAAYDNIGLPAYISDVFSFEILYINESAKKLLGDVVGKKCYEVLNGTCKICDGCTAKNIMKTKGPITAKGVYMKKIDMYFDIYQNIIERKDKTPAILCLMSDVTRETKLMKENQKSALKAKELENTLLLQSGFINSAASMMSAISDDGKIIFTNDIMAKTLGYTKEELFGRKIEDLYPVFVARILKEEYISEAKNKGICKSQSLIQRKDKSIIPINQTIFPIKNENGEILAMATIAEDITNDLTGEIKEQYQIAIMDSSTDYISVANLNKQVIYNSPGAYRMVGYKPGEIGDLSIEQVCSKKYSELLFSEGIPMAIKNGQWTGRGELISKNGTEIPVEQTIFPVFDKKNNLIGVATIIHNISEKIKNEKMLEKQFSLQKALSEFSVNFTKSLDFDKLINNALYLLSKYIKADKLCIFIDNKSKKMFENKFEYTSIPEYNTLGITFDYSLILEYYNKIINMPQVYFEDCAKLPEVLKNIFKTSKSILFVPIHLEGEYLGIVVATTLKNYANWDESEMNFMRVSSGILANAYAKNSSEERVAKAQTMLRKIIDTTPSGIFWKDRGSRFLGANLKFAMDAGFDDPEKIKGLNDYDIYPREIAEKYTSYDEEIFKSGEDILYFEEPFVTAEGEKRWVSTSKVLIKDSSGNAFSLLGVYDDITARKRNEEQLEKAIKTAEDASRAKSEFLSRMSHEIRTPMNAIIGMTKIGQTTQDYKKMQYCLEKIDGASKHLLGLINDILDMSKIEASKFELFAESFCFEKMLENICNVILVKAEEKYQKLIVDVDTSVPELVIGDEMRLSQVITNLLSNSIKFTPENGTVKLTAKRLASDSLEDVILKISVEDNGIGLTNEQKAKLFTSFEQADGGIARKYGGTGLGLSICKKIVELMGGNIDVTSEFGKGSTFYFTINLKKSEIKQNNVGYDFSAYKNLRVMVIDEDKSVLNNFSNILSSVGINHDLAGSGSDAIDYIKKANEEQKPYQIVFVEYLADEMDGITVARHIKSLENGRTNVVMMSQTKLNTVEKEASAAGVTDFILKPIFRFPVLEIINRLIMGDDSLSSSSENNDMPVYENCHMLLAEDIEINREIAISLLEDTKIIIDSAENGQEALELFEKNQEKYDIIIMDVQMPVMDGLEATRRIRALGTKHALEVPIVAMTANAFAEDVEACKNAGMIDHIGKPIDVDILLSKIGKYLHLR